MKPPAVDDLHLHVELSSLTAGPEGWAWVAKSINREKDQTDSAVWTYSADAGVQRVTADGYGPAWACDGHALAFLRSIDGTPQIFVHRPGDEAPTQVTHLESGVSSIEQWDSIRGRFLVRIVERADLSKNAPRHVRYLPYKQDGLGVVVDETTRAYCIDARSGQATQLACGDGDVLEVKWSPDGQALAWIMRRTGTQRHRMDLWIKRGSDEPRQLTDHLVSISGLSWSPDGSRMAVAASEIEGDSLSFLHVVHPDHGASEEVGHVEMTMPSAIQWDAECTRLLVTQAHRGLQRVVMVHLQGSVEVIWERHDQQAFEMAAAAGRIGFFVAGANNGPELHVCESDGSQVRSVSDFNAWRENRPRIAAVKRAFDVPDGNGGTEPVEGWLLTPAGEGRFPLLLDMHGGPHSMVTLEYERYVHWAPLVNQGWAILAMNSVGSSSYGDEFASRICGRWGEVDFPQWQAAVATLQREGVAGEEIACFGHSYGGFLSAWALSHDDTLMCGVVSGGVINLESHTGTSDSGYYVGPYAMCGELIEVRERYRALSPLSHVEHIHAPVLLLQGQEDERCPVGQAEELLAALVRKGDVKVEMVLFPGGSHHVSSTGQPSQRVAYYENLIAWLEDARAPSRASAGHVEETDARVQDSAPEGAEQNPHMEHAR